MAATTIDDLLKASNDASAQARTTWFTFMLFGAYLGVTIGSTTHKQLLLDAPIELPLLSVKLPIQGFYRLVPLLLVLVHYYALVQLYLLSRTLHLLDDAIEREVHLATERERVRARVDSFVVAQLIAGVNRSWIVRLFMRFAAWVTMLAAPVLLLLGFQIVFLPYHDVTTTWTQRIALAADLFLCWLLWPAVTHPSGRLGGVLVTWVRGFVHAMRHSGAAAFALGRRIERQGWRLRIADLRAYFGTFIEIRDASAAFGRQIVAVAGLVSICGGVLAFSLFLATIPGEDIEGWLTDRMTDLRPGDVFRACVRSGPRPALFDCLQSLPVWAGRTPPLPDDAHRAVARAWWPTLLLFGGDPSIVDASPFKRDIVLGKAERLFEIDSDKFSKVERTIDLHNRDLRGANLSSADLRKADLSEARLDGARLNDARLTGANLDSAHFYGAVLTGARLEWASLKSADLEYAIIDDGDMQGAVLENANLAHASAQFALFEGSNLQFAQLRQAHFNGAAFEGAVLSYAVLRWADLQDADLEGASLREASLEGANLDAANLTGADLRKARVWCAALPGAGRNTDLADVRDLEMDPPSRDDAALDHSAPLSAHAANCLAAGSPAPEEAAEQWLKASQRRWDEQTDEKRLGDYLPTLGCDARWAPYVARGLALRLWSDWVTAHRAYAPRVAAALLASSCEGARGLPDDDHALLEKVVGGGPPAPTVSIGPNKPAH